MLAHVWPSQLKKFCSTVITKRGDSAEDEYHVPGQMISRVVRC